MEIPLEDRYEGALYAKGFWFYLEAIGVVFRQYIDIYRKIMRPFNLWNLIECVRELLEKISEVNEPTKDLLKDVDALRLACKIVGAYYDYWL